MNGYLFTATVHQIFIICRKCPLKFWELRRRPIVPNWSQSSELQTENSYFRKQPTETAKRPTPRLVNTKEL